jgi:hypothetical protein
MKRQASLVTVLGASSALLVGLAQAGLAQSGSVPGGMPPGMSGPPPGMGGPPPGFQGGPPGGFQGGPGGAAGERAPSATPPHTETTTFEGDALSLRTPKLCPTPAARRC